MKTILAMCTLCLWTSAFAQTNAIDSLSVSEKSSDVPANERISRISDSKEFIYKKPGKFDYIKQAPSDFVTHVGNYFKKENLPIMGAIFVSTVALVPVDQRLVDNAKEFGRDVGISSAEYSVNLSPYPDYALFVPSDLGTAMYFIGDGFTHLTIDLGFLTYGLIKDDNRALQTASQILEGLAVTGAWVQVLKHTTGRESPDRATAPGGVWQVFPNQKDTFKDVPKYDAFPSGHLATVMSTLTIISENYPEHKFIRPLGYSLMTLLAYQMMNNGVHWASDYPLALFIGHNIGNIIVNKGRTVRDISTQSDLSSNTNWYSSLSVTPARFSNGAIGVHVQYVF
ncbi:phosphatase PAP2 family protein [candidate division KSB1 bacterium]|nr:phosphatase PAP2 family protein [candidate division KSB1 bacterium]